MEVVPDDYALIEDRLHHYVDERLRPRLHHRRHRPDARRRHARGDARRDRARRARLRRGDARRGARHTPLGILTRGVSGIAGRTLIVNFPGSPKAIDELVRRCSRPTLSHVVETLRGDSSHHDEPIELRWSSTRRATASGSRSTGVSLALDRRRTLAVFGANGAGKSTLLRVLATLLRPHGGDARVLGASCPREGWTVRGRVGFLGHEPLLYRDLTGAREPALPRAPARRGRGARRRAARRRWGWRGAPTSPCARSRAGWCSALAVVPRGAARARAAAARRAAREPRPGARRTRSSR